MYDRYAIGEGPVQPGRRYFHHDDLEEYQGGAGMWRVISGPSRAGYANAAERLMAAPLLFQSAMRRALVDWPNSVAAALTASGNNQRAWMGQAGCYLATGSPEECTRQGWHQLSAEEQWRANHAADVVIEYWHQADRAKTYAAQLALFGEMEQDIA